MGIVNVTPDSFSDGGEFMSTEAAVRHGLGLIAAGANIVDVGGESTRPGSEGVSVAEELDRVLPVIRGLAAKGAVISVDTTKAEVAAEALNAGAAVVNDVSALGDPDMAGLIADSEAGVVLMHMQGTPRTMQADPRYDDVVGEVAAALNASVAKATAAGIDAGAICIDPGVGFGKTTEHNLELLSRLPVLTDGDRPVLIGASRKRFLGQVLGTEDPKQRDLATAVVGGWAIMQGVFALRVHDVGASLQIARIADAIVRPNVRSEP
jgi:dihydropteroate synthase